jgi:hypothetical protein
MWTAIIILALGLVTAYAAYKLAPVGLRTVIGNVFVSFEAMVAAVGDAMGVVDLSGVLEPQYLTLTLLTVTAMNGFFRYVTTTPIGER